MIMLHSKPTTTAMSSACGFLSSWHIL